MRVIAGSVLVQESSRGVGGLTVAAFSHEPDGSRLRVGSVATAEDGQFRIEHADADADTALAWNLQLEVSVDGIAPAILYSDAKPRMAAGPVETWVIRVPLATLVAAGVLGAQDHSPAATAELPALGTFLARVVADASFESEIHDAVRARLDPRRDTAQATAHSTMDFWPLV